MRNLSSRAVSIVGTATLALALTGLACAEDDPEHNEVRADYGVICVRTNPDTGEDVRVDRDECARDNPTGSWVWVNQTYGYRSPAIGGKLPKGTATWTAPTVGTTAAAPDSGGFGTYCSPCGG